MSVAIQGDLQPNITDDEANLDDRSVTITISREDAEKMALWASHGVGIGEEPTNSTGRVWLACYEELNR